MKKIFYSLTFLILLFINVNIASAANYCYYINNDSDIGKEDGVTFRLDLDNGQVISMDKFEGVYDKTTHNKFNYPNGFGDPTPWVIKNYSNLDSCPSQIYYIQQDGTDIVSIKELYINSSDGRHKYKFNHIANECKNADYPCAVCNYTTDVYDVIYIAKQDNVDTYYYRIDDDNSKLYDFYSDMNYSNFYDVDKKIFFCPDIYIQDKKVDNSHTTTSKFTLDGYINLQLSQPLEQNENMLNSYTNNKVVSDEFYVCKYTDTRGIDKYGIRIEYNLTKNTINIMNFESNDYYNDCKTIEIIDDAVKAEDYQGKCPNYAIHMDQSSEKCTISKITDSTPDKDLALGGAVSYGSSIYEFHRQYLGSLIYPLSAIDEDILKINIKVLKNVQPLGTLKDYANDNVCAEEECSKHPEYYAEKALKEVKLYCNNIYSTVKNSEDIYTNMVEDCLAFENFYATLVQKGYIGNAADDCSILSQDMIDKLKWVLDLFKIAGPVLALGLGTLDFIKVMANGDADKEMKNAFKRFSTRLIAAFLLFIIPVILAFFMDIFLGNQDGYNSDNPFCIEMEFDK